MSLYAETPLANGATYKRAASIVIDNNLGRPQPIVTYHEETVVLSNGTPVFSQQRGIISGAVNLTANIALRDPATGNLTGSELPVAVLYQALYSDYVNRAEARDTLLTSSAPTT